jgi:hypothetical protein
VLAQQPSGYFVLNDMLRYINEEGDDDVAEAADEDVVEVSGNDAAEAVEVEAEVPKVEEAEEESNPVELDATVIDKKLEEVGTGAKIADITPAVPILDLKKEAPSEVPDPDQTVEEIAEEEVKKAEVPKDPIPTPVPIARPAAPAAEPEKPKEPPKPMTWASRAAAAAGPARPVVPVPKTATPPASAPTRAPAPAAQTPAPAAAAATATATESSPAKDLDSEWQTAGADSKRQNRPVSMSRAPTDKDNAMAYIKYVTDKVKDEDLRAALAHFGELAYFDVNRQKVCIFLLALSSIVTNMGILELRFRRVCYAGRL